MSERTLSRINQLNAELRVLHAFNNIVAANACIRELILLTQGN